MKWLLSFVLVLGACKKPEPPPKNEFEAFERRYRGYHAFLLDRARKDGETIEKADLDPSYRAMFIGPSGVFVDRKLVATLAELETKQADIAAAIDANIAMVPSVRWTPVVTFALETEPASVAVSALRLFKGKPVQVMRVVAGPDMPVRASETLCEAARPADPTAQESEGPKLSVLIDARDLWLGLSKINEFQQIPKTRDGYDFERLETTLKEHKASSFFAERADMEIAAKAGTSGDVLIAMSIACKVGFVDPTVMLPEQLSAKPPL